MDFPLFSVTEYGMFDSAMKFPTGTVSRRRPVTEFELEFYTDEHPPHIHLDECEYPCASGTLICAKPGQTRYSHLPFKCLYLHLICHDNALRTRLEALPDSMNVEEPEVTEALFTKLIRPEADSPEQMLLLSADICALIAHILQLAGLHKPAVSSAAHAHRRQLLEIRQYIDRSYAEPLTLAAMAAQINLSPIYFHRLFSEFFGKTPSQYLLERRVSAARIELLVSERTLAEIAANCGFSSQSYFSSKFSQVMGVSPAKYRRNMLSKLDI